MISWFVPLSSYPAGYGGDKKVALPLISLASMKNYMALHMVCFYGQPAMRESFVAQYAKSGKKLDMGQGCLRFKTLPDLALDVVEKTVARLPGGKEDVAVIRPRVTRWAREKARRSDV